MRTTRPRYRYRADRAGDHAVLTRRRRWPWIVGGALVVIVATLAVVGTLFAREALSVRDDLLAAKSKLGQITALVSAGDTAGIQQVADETLDLTTRADTTVRGPLWDLSAAIPFVGQNVSAVREATEATHILVRDAVPVGVRLLENINPRNLQLEGGGINLEPFEAAQADLPAINTAFGAAKEKIDPIDLDALHPVVSDALRELVDVINDAAPALEMLEKYLPTVLPMLGSEGPRTYMVLFQNNAEIRALGGNPGAFSVMVADQGRVETREDAATAYAYWIGRYADLQYVDLPEETLSLYEYDFAIRSQNFTRTPNFPTAASMFSGMWNTASGETLDGVISIDPVMLARMLAVTGPVTLDDGSQVTADNAVSLLLFDAYETYSSDAASNEYFAMVADRVFEKITSGNWDPMAMFAALQWGVEEQRVYGWFPREAEQALAADLDFDGELSADNAAETEVGVFVNDAAYSKLEYFYSQEVHVSCDTAARTTTTTLTMHNTITDPNLNNYTLGWRNNNLGLPRTTMILDVLYFAPPGSTIASSDPSTSDFDGWDRSGAENGHFAESISVAVPMGESRTVSFTSSIPEGDLGPIAVRYAPTVGETPVTIDDSCKGL